MTSFGMSHQNDNEKQVQRVQTEQLHKGWSILQSLTKNSRKIYIPVSRLIKQYELLTHTNSYGFMETEISQSKMFCLVYLQNFTICFTFLVGGE